MSIITETRHYRAEGVDMEAVLYVSDDARRRAGVLLFPEALGPGSVICRAERCRPLRVSRICPHWPSRSSVVLYRVSQVGRCIDSKRAWWPIWQPSQIVRPCVPSRDTALRSAWVLHCWRIDSTSPYAWNKVPSRSMACMMTASRRARATRAFLRPRRFAIFMAQVFRGKVSRMRVSIELAAS
jgi:hypothetical protein